MEENKLSNEAVGAVENVNPSVQAGNWYDSLPEDIKPAVSKYESMEAMARSAVSSDNLLVKKVSDFADNEFEAFALRAGKIQKVPLSESEYKIDTVGKDENSKSMFSNEDIDALKKYALSNRMSNEQAQAMYNLCNTVFVKINENNAKSYESGVEQTQAFLKKHWGNEYDTKLSMISNTFPKAAEIIGMCTAEEAANYLRNNPMLKSDPFVNLLMEKVCTPYSDVSKGYSHVGTTPMDAKAEIENLKKDPDFRKSLGDRLHPNHAANKKRFEALHKQAFN